MKMPPSCSFVSANGPSVTTVSPSTTRTTFASAALTSSRPCTLGSAFPNSSKSAIQRGIDSSRAAAASAAVIAAQAVWSL